MEYADLTGRERLSHSLGPATAKARSPLNFSLDLGYDGVILSDDRKHLAGLLTFTRSDKQDGARLNNKRENFNFNLITHWEPIKRRSNRRNALWFAHPS